MNLKHFAMVGVLLTAASLQAATLAEYLLNGSATSSDTNANSVASSLSVSGITLGYATVGGQQGTDVTASGVDAGDYYAFTLTADSGFKLDLGGGSITLQDRTSIGGTFSYSVFTSVDSYAAPLVTYSLATANVWSDRTVNLSGPVF